MKIEDMLREQFQREVGSMPALEDLESRFAARRRRHRIVRAARVGAIAAAAIAVAVAVPVVMGGSRDGGFVGPGGSEPSPSPTQAPGGTAAHPVAGYQVEVPDGWWERVDPDGLTVFAPTAASEPGPPGGATEFSVAILPTQETFPQVLARVRATYSQDAATPGVTVSDELTLQIDGRHAVSIGGVYPDDPRLDPGEDGLGGCRDCRTTDYVVHWIHGYTLHVRIVARSTEANERWGGEGLQVVAAIRQLWEPGFEYQPRNGEVAGGVEVDATTEEVLRFMDARIEGAHAEEWLSPNARRQYRDGEGGLSLYSPTSNPHYARYIVVGREAVDANSFEYVVEIVEEYTGEGETDRFRERLFVGPWPEVIRGAMHCGEECL